MKLCFFTKYTRAGPSSRYRFYQYIPFLEAAGIEVVTYPLLGDEYIEALFSRKRVSLRTYLGWFLNRLRHLWRSKSTDLLYIEYELLPYFPFVLERFFWPKEPKVVLEYDDAIYIRYRRYPWLRGKIDRVVAAADAVVVANRFLYDYAVRLNSNVHLVPSAVDVTRYGAREEIPGESKPIVIGWIGTPATVNFLSSVQEPLRIVTTSGPAVLRCIGAPPDFALPGVSLERVPWSESTEVEELQKCHIGIMPLAEGDFELGKSGLKLVQYMACGLPCVTSPGGAGAEIIREGENGFLARSQKEWVERLSRLIEDPALRKEMGSRGRKAVEENYSLEVTAPKLIQLFQELCGR